MRPLRNGAIATAGTNTVLLGLSTTSRLRTIRIVNETKGFTTISAELVKRGDRTTTNTVGLINRVIQPGDRDVGWDGDIIITPDFPDIRATFFDADLADVLVITCGVEDV